MSNSLQQTESSGQQKSGTNHKQRLLGLDLFRGIAAFAVVILHADEGMTEQPLGWSAILNFSAFAVPFFLAASFYLTVSKLNMSQKSPDWGVRLTRLLIPYGFWSLVYLGQNILKFVIRHQPEKLQGLLNNGLGLIFLGKAGFHLYFIPLLVTGILIMIILLPLIRIRFSRPTLVGFVIASLIIYQCYRAFMSVELAEPGAVGVVTEAESLSGAALETLLTLLGYAARCLPYITIALLLSHSSIQRRLLQFNLSSTVLICIFFIVVNGLSSPLWFRAIHELSIGYSALFLALAISSQLKMNKLIASVGQCSFGIYLMHLLFVNALWSLFTRMNLVPDPISISIPLAIALLAFGSSWIVTSLLIKQKFLSRVMFGVS